MGSMPEEDHVLRVASYNLRGLRDDVAALIRVVRSIDPDVLLVQEIPRRPLASRRIPDLAHRCGLRWSGRTRRVSGTGVMTSPRVQAQPSRDRALPVGLGQNPRSYTFTALRRPGGRALAVASIHLPLIASQRVQHAGQVMSELTVDPALRDLPWVVGGDLNESGDGAAWQALARHLQVVSPVTPTFPSGDPRRCIDALFASPVIGICGQRPVHLERAALTAATDHLPVWADVCI